MYVCMFEYIKIFLMQCLNLKYCSKVHIYTFLLYFIINLTLVVLLHDYMYAMISEFLRLSCIFFFSSMIPTKALTLYADYMGLSTSMDEFIGRGKKD